MARVSILVCSMTALLLPFVARGQEAPREQTQVIEVPPYRSPNEKIPDLKVVTERIVVLTNKFRESEKRAGVAESKVLMETAKGFAEYMASTDRYGHEADGSNPGDRATKRGYEFGLISENIAYSFSSEGFEAEALAKQFEEGWEKSPGHRRNMLDPDVTETGVAVSRSEKTGYYYAVQMFGRPKSASIKFEVVNRSDSAVSYKIMDRGFKIEPRYTMQHEVGRPADMTYELETDGKLTPLTFKVENKSRFLVVDEAGAVKVKRE